MIKNKQNRRHALLQRHANLPTKREKMLTFVIIRPTHYSYMCRVNISGRNKAISLLIVCAQTDSRQHIYICCIIHEWAAEIFTFLNTTNIFVFKLLYNSLKCYKWVCHLIIGNDIGKPVPKIKTTFNFHRKSFDSTQWSMKITSNSFKRKSFKCNIIYYLILRKLRVYSNETAVVMENACYVLFA